MTCNWEMRCLNPSIKETEVGRVVGDHTHFNSDALHPLKSRYLSVLEHYQGPNTYNSHEKVAKEDEDEDNDEDIMSELDDLSRLVYDLNTRDYAKHLAATGGDKPGSIPAIEDDDYDWQESSMEYAGSVHSIESYMDDELFDFSQDLMYHSYEDSNMEPSLCSSDLEESSIGRFVIQEV